MVHRRGLPRHPDQRHHRGVVLAVDRGADDGRRERDRGRRRPDAGPDRLHRLHGEGGLGAGEARRRRRGRRRRVDGAAVREAVRPRDRAVLQGPRGRDRRAADGLQLGARHGGRHEGRSDPAARRDRHDRLAQGLDPEPRPVLRDVARRCRPAPRLRAVHVHRRLRAPEGVRRRRLHRRRVALGRPRRQVLGGLVGRRRGGLPRPRAPHRGALPEAVAAGRLGRAVRRLPEPAEGADEDARPAGRRTAPPAPAGGRPAVARGDALRARRVRPADRRPRAA